MPKKSRGFPSFKIADLPAYTPFSDTPRSYYVGYISHNIFIYFHKFRLKFAVERSRVAVTSPLLAASEISEILASAVAGSQVGLLIHVGDSSIYATMAGKKTESEEWWVSMVINHSHVRIQMAFKPHCLMTKLMPGGMGDVSL